MPRYGIIVKQDDGTEIVSDVKEMNPGPPYPGSDNAKVVKDLDPRVKIGMIRGGKGAAVAGFGWPSAVASAPAREPDAKEVAEAKKAESRARLEEAKADDNFAEKFEAKAASTRAKAETKATKAETKAASKS